MGRTKESVPQGSPTVFKSQNNFIILNLPFTYNGIFRSVHFQDLPKVIFSRTVLYLYISNDTVYAIDWKHTLGTHLASQASFQIFFQQRSNRINENRLFQANYGAVYISRSNGSKALSVLIFRALDNSILVQWNIVLSYAYGS